VLMIELRSRRTSDFRVRVYMNVQCDLHEDEVPPSKAGLHEVVGGE